MPTCSSLPAGRIPALCTVRPCGNSRIPPYQRVLQADWETPKRRDWANNITQAVTQATSPVVFVAHSLGCIAVAHWFRMEPEVAYRIKGALLVAPADVDCEDVPLQTKDFSPIPRQPLPCASVVVA